MSTIRIALAQINTTVGAFPPNAAKIARLAREAADKGSGLVLFPEMALAGYPPQGLLSKPHFVEDCGRELIRLRRSLPESAVCIIGTPYRRGSHLYSAAAIFTGGRRVGVHRKTVISHLLTADEPRYLQPGHQITVLELGGYCIGVTISDDLTCPNTPLLPRLQAVEPDLVVNIAATPYYRGKPKELYQQLAGLAARLNCPLAYCNLVGGQDEVVFDGGSLIIAPDGSVLGRARMFEPDLLIADLGLRQSSRRIRASRTVRIIPAPVAPFADGEPALPRVEPEKEAVAELYQALALSLRDYADKNGFTGILVGVSGGIDSALVATIARDALGPQRVVCVSMPSQYSSPESQQDAEQLARNLGATFMRIPIDPIFNMLLTHLRPQWPAHEPDVTEENLQARIRGIILMALSNKLGYLVVATGNRSEVATGYCTLYGDTVGGFALLKEVPKTLVYELARWRNAQEASPIIPPSIIARPPSAELRPGQKDTDKLPPYEILDPILELYLDERLGVEEIISRGFEPELVKQVIRMVDLCEYKRRQSAPGPLLSYRALYSPHRLPITNLYWEHL